jgi:hypothetical protein
MDIFKIGVSSFLKAEVGFCKSYDKRERNWIPLKNNNKNHTTHQVGILINSQAFLEAPASFSTSNLAYKNDITTPSTGSGEGCVDAIFLH